MSGPLTSPTITALSLGAGVQSTTLALLAVEGVLPKPDVAIFADTGWEPRAVYEHLDRLEAVLRRAGIEPLRVSRGNLRADMIDTASRFASLPYFILAPEGAKPELIECRRCKGEGECTTEHPVEDAEGNVDEATRVPMTYECPTCNGTGEVPTGRMIPLTRREREGMGRRQCTSEYKLTPIRRKVRELLGAAPPDFRRVPAGKLCEQWVGFSTDEVERANRRKDSDGVSYLSTRYPLLELDMSRDDCDRWLRARGWSTEKSACIGCPYHGNRAWRELRDNRPDEWADAVDFDEAIRKGGKSAGAETLRGEAFLHRSRLPLAIAPIDRVTRAEWQDAQTDIFGQLADQALEDGDPDGCSPYGCRSGDSVDGAA